MDYIEITVSTNTPASESVSEVLTGLGAMGTQIIDRADLPDIDHPVHDWELIDQAVYDAMPEDVQVKAWFPADERDALCIRLDRALDELRQTLTCGAGTLKVSVKPVSDSDWNETWKQYYKPLRIGQRLVIKPSWEAFEAQKEDLVIQMDPGMAFGTGTHETTALCAEMIEKYYTGGVLADIGTGSGILAICAAKLCARSVVAVDIDEDAVRVAEENVRLNGLEKVIRVRQGDLTKGLDARFDFVAANILAPILLRLLPALPAHMTNGGIAVLSGLLCEQEEDIAECAVQNGFEIVERKQKGDWSAIVIRKQ